ncbi:MAG: hypothetical protein E7650_06530 [Ruminococcaceae bacterium]|nr:hypothetical protein [Oscillospiraceae bacterium]
MRIDFHSHCFPDALAPRAMIKLKQNCSADAAITPHTDGTAADTERLLRAAGIDRAVVCNIATNQKQEYNVNSFAISLTSSDFFLPLGSLHPDSTAWESELDRLAAAGIKGIKLHPDYVGIPFSDARFDRLLSVVEERGFFVVLHAGLDPISPDFIHATPEMIAAVHKRHKRLPMVAAHMGGYRRAAEVLQHLCGTDVYLDTSLSVHRAGEAPLLWRLLRDHDQNRLLFASDTPWSNPKKEIAFIENAGLPVAVQEKIFYKNAQRLLGKRE